MAAKKVYILDFGSLVLDRSHIMWGMEPGTPTRFPAYGVLIDHPDGLIVYDTGFDLDYVSKVVPFGLPEQTPEQMIPRQLASAGFDPEQVSLVVNSHLHFDHSGGNKHLTNATTLVSKEEMRHAKVPEPFEQLGYCDPGFDHPEARYQQISGDIVVMNKPNWYLFAKPTTYASTHGSPWAYDTNVPLAMYGPSWIKAGKYGDSEVVDLARTIAFILNVRPPNGCEGRVLLDILN